jgi:hypothetical protein
MEAWVTTNGSILTRELLGGLLSAGLSHLTLSLQTPDEQAFAFRNAGLLSYETYERRVVETVQAFLEADWEANLTVCFFSNPLRVLRPDPLTEMARQGRTANPPRPMGGEDPRAPQGARSPYPGPDECGSLKNTILIRNGLPVGPWGTGT